MAQVRNFTYQLLYALFLMIQNHSHTTQLVGDTAQLSRLSSLSWGRKS